ncbi:MAG: hypothetical protein WAX04_10475 [Oscillospiraceae bacterium]
MNNTNDDILYAVGKYKQVFNDTLAINLPCETIYQSIGLKVHVSKKHSHCLKYLNSISEIISSPDYIGCNPKESSSIEFIKCYDENIKVAVKLDTRKNYLYVASLYDIKDAKLQTHLHSGRLKEFNKSVDTDE